MKTRVLLVAIATSCTSVVAYAGSNEANKCSDKVAPTGCNYILSGAGSKCVIRCATNPSSNSPTVIGGGGGGQTSGSRPQPLDGHMVERPTKEKDLARVKPGSN